MSELFNNKLYQLLLLSIFLYGGWKLYLIARSYGEVNVKKNENEIQLMIRCIQDHHAHPATKKSPIMDRVKYAEELVSQLTVFLKKGNSQRLSQLILDYTFHLHIFVDENILQNSESTRCEVERGEELLDRLNEMNIIYRDMVRRH